MKDLDLTLTDEMYGNLVSLARRTGRSVADTIAFALNLFSTLLDDTQTLRNINRRVAIVNEKGEVVKFIDLV